MSLADPKIERVIDLRLQGDWGMANFHRVCGWLAQEVGARSARTSTFPIYTGTGGSDALFAVHRREVDIAITTPAYFATMAAAGAGPYAGEPLNDLRALAVLPQRDRLAFAIDPKFGVSTFEEIRRAKLPLRISVCTQAEGNLIGYASERVLAAAGLGRAELERWGGSIVEFTKPEYSLAAVLDDPSVDAVLQEAIMTPWWRDVIAKSGYRFVPIEDAAIETLHASYGWRAAPIAAGFFDGVTTDVQALDFSDFLVFTHADLPEDVAHLTAWVLTETRELFERQYRHIPAANSPVTYPLDPATMARAPIPLHPGARAHYQASGYLS
jgi:TRAP-type uncharacterized transport system substrate-binding protein